MSERRCTKCKSETVELIGHYATWIALDEPVDWLQYMCTVCEYEWEE